MDAKTPDTHARPAITPEIVAEHGLKPEGTSACSASSAARHR